MTLEQCNQYYHLAIRQGQTEYLAKALDTYQNYLQLNSTTDEVYEQYQTCLRLYSQRYLESPTQAAFLVDIGFDIPADKVLALLKIFQQTFAIQDSVSLILYHQGRQDLEEIFDQMVRDLDLSETELLDYVILEPDSRFTKAALLAASRGYLYWDAVDDSQMIPLALQMETEIIGEAKSLEAAQLPSELVHSFVLEQPETLRKALLSAYQQSDHHRLRQYYLQSFAEPVFDPQSIVAKIDEIEVVAIFIWGRSGSLFMQTLFDSHPQVLTMPGPKLAYFHSVQWLTLASVLRERPAITPEELIDIFIQLNSPSFENPTNIDGLAYLGDNRDQAVTVDPQLFKTYLVGILKSLKQFSRKNFFVGMHYAYALALGQEVDKKSLIVYQLHAPDLYDAFHYVNQDFPTLKYIGMVRYPPKALHSFLNGLKNNHQQGRDARDENPDFAYEDLVYNGEYSHVYRHQLTGWSYLPKKYPKWQPFPVKLEDLHAEPQQMMQRLAKWLNLDWNECLLDSTFNGLAYWGDSYMKAKGQPLRGFSKDYHSSKSYQAWKENLDAIDCYVLMALAQQYVESFGYCKVSWLQKKLLPLLLFIPTKLERKALKKALKTQDKAAWQQTVIYILERYLHSYKYLYNKEIPSGVIEHKEI